MVVDVRELMYRLNRRPSVAIYPDEVWLRLDGSVNERNQSKVST